ncbi:hypothetical protein FISHEDRAFT_42741, partial [Fistulina hepatica ATCC 64428]
FMPKFIGPYTILRERGINSYELEMPNILRRRGIHNVFHASLLRIYIPNDNRRFPNRVIERMLEFVPDGDEIAIEGIIGHAGKGDNALHQEKHYMEKVT